MERPWPIESPPGIRRRSFLIGAAGSVAAQLAYVIGSATAGQSDERLTRETVTGKLRSEINGLLDKLEAQTGLSVQFRPLPIKYAVVAEYTFEQCRCPIIRLRSDWEDVDLAHELMHMRLELVDGYAVLAWRKNVERDKVVESAFGLIRSYTDDMLVFDLLAKMGLSIDGGVIKRQFFDDVCTNVPRYLREGRSLKNDGMAHLDHVAEGCFSDLRRSTFLVQAELLMKAYGKELSGEHERLLKDFICAFRTHRVVQAARADRVLAFFEEHHLASIRGHARILTEWATLEGLDSQVGVSSYARCGEGFTLPYPDDCRILEQGRRP